MIFNSRAVISFLAIPGSIYAIILQISAGREIELSKKTEKNGSAITPIEGGVQRDQFV